MRSIHALISGCCCLALGACGGASNDPGGAAGGTGGGGRSLASCGTTVTAAPDNNYTFHSELTIDVTKVKPSTEIFFDWSALTTDFLDHAVDLNGIGMVEIGLWNLTLDEFEQGLNDDTLGLSDLAIIATILPAPGKTTGSILELTEMGEPIEPARIMTYLDIANYPPENHVYTVMVADGFNYGDGTRMIQGFQLDAASTNTQVKVMDASTHLEMTADLHSLKTPGLPVGNSGIVIDWTDMQGKPTAAGLPFDPQLITQLRVGKYALTPSEMELKETFLNLDAKAEVMYSTKVKAGTSIELAKATDPAGNPFPGIDDAHTWMVALNCAECKNPAPWYMSVLKPCTP